MILLQKRQKPGETVCWELPGGQVEEFESLFCALRREVLEETGLTVTAIHGSESLVMDVADAASSVECYRPFAVYQTTQGPVDSMGVLFRCTAEGTLLDQGDMAAEARWVSVETLVDELAVDPANFSWVDRAALQQYIRYRAEG